MANEVKIKITANTRQAETAITGLQDTVKKFSGTIRMAGVAMSAFGAAGIFASVKFAQAALEQEKAMAVLGNAVEKGGIAFASVRKEIEATTAALQAKTNYGDEVQMRALGQMVALSGDYEASLKALPALLDLSTALQIDLAGATNLVGRGLSGNIELFSRYGIVVEKGITSQGLINLLLDKFGGAAEANRDPLKQLTNTWGDFGEALGRAVMPVLIPSVILLTRMFDILGKLNPKLLAVGGTIFMVSAGFSLFLGPLAIAISMLPAAIAGFTALAGAMGALSAASIASAVGMIAAFGWNIGLVAAGAVATAVALQMLWGALTGGETNPIEIVKGWTTSIKGAMTSIMDMTEQAEKNQVAMDKLAKTMAESLAKAAEDSAAQFDGLETSMQGVAEVSLDDTTVWLQTLRDEADRAGENIGNLWDLLERPPVIQRRLPMPVVQGALGFERTLLPGVQDAGVQRYIDMTNVFKELLIPTRTFKEEVGKLVSETGNWELAMGVVGNRMEDHLLRQVKILAEGFVGGAEAFADFTAQRMTIPEMLDAFRSGIFRVNQGAEEAAVTVDTLTQSFKALAEQLDDPRLDLDPTGFGGGPGGLFKPFGTQIQLMHQPGDPGAAEMTEAGKAWLETREKERAATMLASWEAQAAHLGISLQELERRTGQTIIVKVELDGKTVADAIGKVTSDAEQNGG